MDPVLGFTAADWVLVGFVLILLTTACALIAAVVVHTGHQHEANRRAQRAIRETRRREIAARRLKGLGPIDFESTQPLSNPLAGDHARREGEAPRPVLRPEVRSHRSSRPT